MGAVTSYSTPEPGRGTILIVEDPFVSGFLRSVLRRKGYHVAIVDRGRAALMLRDESMPLSLLITNDPAAFTEFCQRIPLLYVAAVPDAEAASLFPANRSLRKPFRPEELVASVEQLLSM